MIGGSAILGGAADVALIIIAMSVTFQGARIKELVSQVKDITTALIDQDRRVLALEIMQDSKE